jgi:integrase
MMPAEPLTAARLQTLKPPSEGVTELLDTICSGLALRLFPSGKCVWTFRYRPRDGGGRKRIRLGEYPAIGLSEARKRALRQKGKVIEGADPAGELQSKRNAPTLSVVIERYLAEVVAVKRKPSTLLLNTHYLRNLIAPELGDRKIGAITHGDVSSLHAEIGLDRKVSANRAMASLSSLFTFAGKQGLVPKGYNPVEGLEKFREFSRERYLSAEEIARLGETLRVAETEGLPWPEDDDTGTSKHERKPENRRTIFTPHLVAAFRLLLFTGCRRSEILHLRWSEIDWERGLLLLPDSKTGKKVVVLSAPALQILSDLEQLGEYVIFGNDVDRPRADLGRPWDLIRHHAGLPGLRLHDLRHSFASIGAGSGMGLPLIGKLLGHKHTQTTQKYAHLDNDPLRRAADRIGSEIADALYNRLPKSEVKKLRSKSF